MNAATKPMPRLRTYLVLGRTSNLPTVWSNCLAGWWLGGHGNPGRLPLLLVGGSLLYLGGMFLNDAFDADFDAQYRRERPIPSGVISVMHVWLIGLVMLVAGLACWFGIGTTCGTIGVVLAMCIVVYDAVHKLITVSPLLMAACRFLLYQAAAATGEDGVTGWAVWCGLALAVYIVGLSYLARKESTGVELSYWPALGLTAPIILALVMNGGGVFENALLLSLVLGLWVIRCLRYTVRETDRNIGMTISGLLAGIVLVDLVSVVDITKPLAGVFIALFLLALLFQRFVPAT